MIKPTFFVIGAAKSATTSLCHLIAQHPDVCFSNPKEPRFFSHDSNFEKGWQWYQTFFINPDKALAIGEGSVHYSMRTRFPNTAVRIAQAIPHAKLIYIVRHPLDRIVSHWRMYDRTGKPEFTTFNQDVKNVSFQPNLIDASKYWFQISAYRGYFPDDQIIVLFYEDFIMDPQETVVRCLDFLNLDTQVEFNEFQKAKNVARDKRVENPFLHSMRGHPIFEMVRKSLPRRIKRKVREAFFLTQDRDAPPQWDQGTREWVIDQLIEDARKFLHFYGKRGDYWLL
jgi:hypothetical protein